MKAALHLFRQGKLQPFEQNDKLDTSKTQLVLGFGAKSLIGQRNTFDILKEKYPAAAIIMCSTSGEIYGDTVFDETVSITALQMEKTSITTSCINIADYADSFIAGKALVEGLEKNGLKYILVLSDGNKVNGSELVKGMNINRPEEVLITGGLAGDADNFESTLVGLNENINNGNIVAVAFYGNNFKVGHGCMGGWDMFGPEKIISKSESNVLHEIDGKNALLIYKEYLGKFAEELPGSALLFPLSLLLPDGKTSVVRTILSIDEKNQTMTFAGDVPVNAKIRFMRANFDKIVDAAAIAATQTLSGELNQFPKLAILISCVGRKLILNNRIDEEVEAVHKSFRNKTMLTGFYSYGEISPLLSDCKCELHNQTMTITTFDES